MTDNSLSNDIIAEREIEGLRFEQISECSPEQHYAYRTRGLEEERRVGYVRVRFGKVQCCYPDHTGRIIFSANLQDQMQGEFSDEDQRNRYLTVAAHMIVGWDEAWEGR